MTNLNNILKRLAEYELEPPADMVERIVHSLGISKNLHTDTLCGSLSRLQSLSVPEMGNSYEAIVRKIEDPIGLFRLHDLEIIPPQFASENIRRGLGIANGKQISGDTRSISIFSKYKFHAAAILLLGISSWLIYSYLYTRVKEAIPPSVVIKKSVVPPIVSPVLKDTITKLIFAKSPKGVGGKYKPLTFSTFSQASIMIGEDQFSIKIIDSDVLASFASFTYNSVPSFISKQEESIPFAIQIDQFTNIAISKPMCAMMKRMNSFKRSGKLTSKARRERKRLERWKTYDQIRFDKKLINNPLDPIDLGEFIFAEAENNLK